MLIHPPKSLSGNSLNANLPRSSLANVCYLMLSVWVDGCFDMMHYGHANALRQVRQDMAFFIVKVTQQTY